MTDKCDEMLINFESPEKFNTSPNQKYLKNPLIPGPDVNCNIESNNPFDSVANSAENWDPFELVLHESLKKVESAQKNIGRVIATDCERSSSISKKNSPIENLLNVEGAPAFPRKVFRSRSVTENIKFYRSPSKNSHKSDDESPSSPIKDSPPLNRSLTDRIKKVVKRRVSKCIERALNSSISQPDLSKPDPASPMKSLSTTLSRLVGVGSDLKCFNKNTNESDSSYQYKKLSTGRLSKSFTTADFCKEDFSTIFEDAKKISLALQNMSITSPKEKIDLFPDTKSPNDWDQEEDLMSIKPPWEENGDISISSESDDSNIGLPKVKLFYLKKKENKRNEITPEEIEHYKRRIRASFDGNMSCDEEFPATKTDDQTIKPAETNIADLTGNSIQEIKPIKEKDPLNGLPVNVPVIPEVNNLRPKKRENLLKKGPMKAIVPLQKMTKSIADKMTPLKKNSLNNVNNLRTKSDNSFSSSIIYPVASSTPTHKVSINTSSSSDPSKMNSRSRLSRRDTEPVSEVKEKKGFRRSVSLTSESRKSNVKVPFSSVNPNIKQNKGSSLNRPHTAPTKTNSSFGRSGPKSRELIRRNITPTAVNDKENRLHAF